jgi:hypothetical protein
MLICNGNNYGLTLTRVQVETVNRANEWTVIINDLVESDQVNRFHATHSTGRVFGDINGVIYGTSQNIIDEWVTICHNRA